jgi:zinc transporter ZupT
MASANSLKLIFGLAIVAVILLAGWYPFKKRLTEEAEHVEFPIGETLATGVFLGAALLHMLPEANILFTQMGYHYPFAFIIAGAVFLFFLWFEHLGKELYHHHETNHPAFAILAWAMLSIHSLMLGAALGLNQSNSLVIMLFLAIITHKWAESFAIAVQLNKSSLSYNKRLLFFLSFSMMTPVGIFIGWYYNHGIETRSLFDPVLIAASAGTFLYLGTLHGLERCVLVERCCNLRDFSFVIIGFLLMASVASYV